MGSLYDLSFVIICTKNSRLWFRRTTVLPRWGFLGRVGRPTTFRNLEAESIADEELVTDKRCNELSMAIVLNATDGLHLFLPHFGRCILLLSRPGVFPHSGPVLRYLLKTHRNTLSFKYILLHL